MADISIIFSEHVLFQMRERKIEKQEILNCLLRADKVVEEHPDRYRAIKIFRRNGKKYLLVVAYDRREKQIEIVTAFITSKVNKYL